MDSFQFPPLRGSQGETVLKAAEELGIKLKSFVLVFVVSGTALLGCGDLAQLGGKSSRSRSSGSGSSSGVSADSGSTSPGGDVTSAGDAGGAPRTDPSSSQELARLAEISLELLAPDGHRRRGHLGERPGEVNVLVLGFEGLPGDQVLPQLTVVALGRRSDG